MEVRVVIIGGTTLLIAAAVVVAIRERRQPAPLPEVPVVQTPAEVRVKAVERNSEPVAACDIDAARFPSREPRRTSMGFGILLRVTE